MYNLFITIKAYLPNENKQVIDFQIQIQVTNLLLVQNLIFLYF